MSRWSSRNFSAAAPTRRSCTGLTVVITARPPFRMLCHFGNLGQFKLPGPLPHEFTELGGGLGAVRRPHLGQRQQGLRLIFGGIQDYPAEPAGIGSYAQL